MDRLKRADCPVMVARRRSSWLKLTQTVEVVMLSRDSEDEMRSRFVFELVI